MKKVIFGIVAIIAVAIFLELFFGFIFFLKDAKQQLIHLKDTLDYPYLYYTFKADSSNFVNEDGLYTKSFRLKDPQRYRIILTGASTARSSGATYNETIAAYLEQELNERFRTKKVEVINAGMPGYVLEQEFIFVQLILQHYSPDMIIGLDGYNDLMSFKLNRYSQFSFAPQNWRDLKVIQKGKAEKGILSRFKVLFCNIARALEFASSLISGKSSYDYSNITEGQLNEAAKAYEMILEDLHDFCSAKGIHFYTILQPVRWYATDGAPSAKFKQDPKLIRLYKGYDEEVSLLPYGFSLTSIFKNKPGVYSDDCHVNPEGNVIFAKKIADFLEIRLAADIKFKNLIACQ
jgi:lysophospholipase L1-like esterase